MTNVQRTLSTAFALALMLLITSVSWAQTATPTQTSTVTPNKTQTAAPTFTAIAAAYAALTPTPNSIKNVGIPKLTGDTAKQLDVFFGGRPGAVNKLLKGASRLAILDATDGTSCLGLTDVVTPVVVAFTKSSGAAATKTLLQANVDYTVTKGDICPNAGHALETWLIIYRPL